MSRLRQILKDRCDVVFPLIIAIVLVLMMLMYYIGGYFRPSIVAQGVRSVVQEAMIPTVNDDYNDVYRGVREDYSGAYQLLTGDFGESLDYDDIHRRLDDTPGLTYRGGHHTQYTEDGGIEFRVQSPDVEIRNALSTSGDNAGDCFVADCGIELEVLMSFGGEPLPPVWMAVETSTDYAPRFQRNFRKVFYCPNRPLCLFVVRFMLTRDGRYRKTQVADLKAKLSLTA